MFASDDLKTYLLRPVVAQGICIFFVFLIILQWISLGTQFWQSTKTRSSQTKPISIENSQQTKQNEQKLTWPLFGEYVPKQFGDMGIKQSKLDLEVVGILYSPRAKDSQVIVRTSMGEEKLFNIGDTLPGNAVIKGISPDAVLVMYHGGLERLSLPKRALTFEPALKQALFRD